jgi:hypothetical protein
MRPGKRTSLRQVLQLQQAAFETVQLLKADAATAEDPELRARIGSSMAQLLRAWDIGENRKRILRGKPLPGSFKPEKPNPKSKRPNWGPIEE